VHVLKRVRDSRILVLVP
jgi:hypothetical protein